MATTTRADLIIPEILEEAIQGAFEGMTALNGTGAAIVNGSLPEGSQRGGDTITIPYFDTLGELEDVTEGDALVPAALTMSDETATVQHSGKMFEITYWAQLAANYADPYAEAARQLRVATERRADAGLITAAATSTLEFDATGETTPTIDYDHVVDAKMRWGDEQDDIVLMVVHSKVYGDMLKLKDGDNRPLLLDARDGSIPRFGGIPVRVSDRLPVVAGPPATYTSLLLKRGALAFWFNGAPRFLTDQDISVDSLLGAIHVYWAAHRYLRRPGNTRTGVVRLLTQ
jgi:hypothetical protein